jgi:hypothetical protein
MLPVPTHLVFVLAFMLGWAIWPESTGIADFIALCAVGFAVTGLVVTLDEAAAR